MLCIPCCQPRVQKANRHLRAQERIRRSCPIAGANPVLAHVRLLPAVDWLVLADCRAEIRLKPLAVHPFGAAPRQQSLLPLT